MKPRNTESEGAVIKIQAEFDLVGFVHRAFAFGVTGISFMFASDVIQTVITRLKPGSTIGITFEPDQQDQTEASAVRTADCRAGICPNATVLAARMLSSITGAPGRVAGHSHVDC